MEWRIRESSHGGFVAEYGGEIKPGTEAGYRPGFFMPGFIVQESARFDTEAQAKRYIEQKKKEKEREATA